MSDLASEVVDAELVADDDNGPAPDAPSHSGAAASDTTGRPTCREPGCDKPVRKVPRLGGFYDYCPEHNAAHGVTRPGGAPAGTPRAAASASSPGSRQPKQLAATRQQAAARVENNVTGWLAMIQAGVLVGGDQYCAWAIGEEGPHIAKAVGEVAADNPWLVKRLDAVDKWGALSVLVFHLAKLGLMVGVHHGVLAWEGPIKMLVPNPFPNMPPPQAPAPEPPATAPAEPHLHREPAPAAQMVG